MNSETKEVIHEFPLRGVGNLATKVLNITGDVEAMQRPPRREDRVNEQKVCGYSLCEFFDGAQVRIEQGEVYSINRSEHGILVLMGAQPRKRQLLELHIAETQWEYSLSLYEVQWTKMVRVESHGELFLVGCRLVFGASRYWAF